MQIIVNGQPKDVPSEITVATLLEQMELDPRTVAVELNLDVVPRAQHSDCILKADDQLEIVTFVGGG